MIYKERGFVSFGAMTLLIGGLGLAMLLFYGWKTGYELSLWQAVAVVLVNLLAAAKIALDTKKRTNVLRQQSLAPAGKSRQR